MANQETAYGLRPIGLVGSAVNSTGVTKYEIASNNTNPIYQYSLVVPTSAGVIDHAGDTAGGTTQALGVLVGVQYHDSTQKKPVFLNYYPTASDYLLRIAGEQIRNVGTVGGNIANGSPIGDLAPLFIALGAILTLRQKTERRDIKVEDFFISIKKEVKKLLLVTYLLAKISIGFRLVHIFLNSFILFLSIDINGPNNVR